MKSRYLNNLVSIQKDYEKKVVDINNLKESLKSKYSSEYIESKVQEARQYNTALKLEFNEKVKSARDSELKELNKGLADELLKSNVNSIEKLLSTGGITLSDTELQSIYDKCLAEKDSLAVRYISEYASRNNRQVTGQPLCTSIMKSEAVNQACEYILSYCDRPLELALVTEKVFPNYDRTLSE